MHVSQTILTVQENKIFHLLLLHRKKNIYNGTDFLLGYLLDIITCTAKKTKLAKRGQDVFVVEEHPTGYPHNPNARDIKKLALGNRIFWLAASFKQKTM